MVWYFHLFQYFPEFVVIHIVKGFGIVDKAEVDVFLELFFFSFYLNFYFYFILLYNTVLVLPYIGMNLPRNSLFFYDPTDVGNLISGSVQWYLKICPQIRLGIRKLISLLRKVYYGYALFGTKAKI